MLKKLAYEVSMSFNISETDKNVAENISKFLVNVVNQIKIIENHLDLITTSFKNAENIDIDYLYQKRGAFARYARQAKENFYKLQINAANAIKLLKIFEIDTHISELIKSLTDSIQQINKYYNDMLDLLNDVKSDDFKKNLMEKIDTINQKLSNLEVLINERIIQHIDENILSKNWINQLNDNYKNQYKAVNDLLMQQNSSIVTTSIRPQIFNPAQQQQIWYPADRRNPTNKGE